MLDDELDRGAATIVVRYQSVGQAQPRFRLLSKPPAEVDGIERLSATFYTQAEFEMPFTDHAPVDDLEQSIEQGLGIALPPWPAAAQRFGVGGLEFLGGEFAIAQQFGMEHGRIHHGLDLLLEGALEAVEVAKI